VFADLIKAGKIRHLGLSNETPWGVSEFCELAEKYGLPKERGRSGEGERI
jgi:aryl-alcohol dehydrogenase-like predicted oxidoreductase